MKTAFPVLFVLALLAAFLFLPSPDTNITQFVDLPSEQEAAITGVFLALFALLFDFAIGKLPWLKFFNQYREAWALATATLSIGWLENILPTGTDSIAIPGVAFLVALVLYLLGRVVLKRRGTQAFS